ncbi:MAG: alginate lyase family protein [Erythrobacter sp.]|uniref:alginate lyase family protein n=1 Tax=Erythrobacter sp. TaxID=1042 RepID=UPI0025CDA76D|nr:alginate lyase family protein [Erythrobacter sp.]MCM0000141.1 alginate lyase family protein [Erythrobacter sp.]
MASQSQGTARARRKFARIRCASLALLLLIEPAGAWAQWGFVHPGAMNSAERLDAAAARVALGREPWSSAMREVTELAVPQLAAISQIDPRVRAEAQASKRLAISTYAHALVWRLTGSRRHGREALRLLDGWAGFSGFTGGTDQDKLQAGWLGSLLGEAAEIMRQHPRWKAHRKTALQAMFRRSFYPHLMQASAWNGNVDLTQVNALLAIAVFNEDRVAFDMGVERLERRSAAYFYLQSVGMPPPINGDGGNISAFWSHPLRWADGLTQETCRDNGHHAQYGLASALHSAEIAWNQGVDVYARQAGRYVAAMELLSQQLLTGDMQGICPNPAATRNVFDTFEVGFHHFHHRMGMDLPHTQRLIIERVRPHGLSDWNIFHETLTHAE